MYNLIGTDARPIMPIPDEWVEDKSMLGKILSQASVDGTYMIFYVPHQSKDEWKQLFRIPLPSALHGVLVRDVKANRVDYNGDPDNASLWDGM